MASALRELRQKAGGAIVALTVIAILIWGFSESIGMPVELRPFATGFVVLAAAFVALSFYTDKSGEFVVTFGIISITLLLVVLRGAQEVGLLPDWIVSVLASVVNPGLAMFGLKTSFETLLETSVSLFILIVPAAAIAIGAGIRYRGDAKSLDVIADRTFERLSRYAETYFDIGRLFVFFLVTLVTLLLISIANFAGQVGDIASQFPSEIATMITGLAGYLSLGGTLPFVGGIPIIGDLTAAEFAFLVIVVLLVAAAVKGRGSGSLSQFIRGRVE